MKIKVLSRNPSDYQRETINDIHKMPRNTDPNLHPLMSEREYIRALNAAKISKFLAKPFLGSMEGTSESMSVISLNSETIERAIFGTVDGKVQYWNIAQKKRIFEVQAHDAEITGICHFNKSKFIYTCSLDNQLKQWNLDHDHIESSWKEPVSTAVLDWTPYCIDHHKASDEFLVGGTQSCLLYSSRRMDCPIREWRWGHDAIHACKFNSVEKNIAGVLTKDNSIILIDSRKDAPLRKVQMKLKLNSLTWNPMEPYVFACASEDYNVYTFDSRNLKFPTRVYRGHVNAVMDVDFSPTGFEMVSGSYDGTIRIWSVDKTEARDVYHTKRMKRVLTVKFTLDSQYILSSSTDQNVRLWKTNAADKLGQITPRESNSLNAANALREKYKDHPEVRKILKRHHLPKSVLAATKEHKIIRAKLRRKERNVRTNNFGANAPPPIATEHEKHTTAILK